MVDNRLPSSVRLLGMKEKWVSGTYIVSGVFDISGEGNSLEDIQGNIACLFSYLQKKRRRKWPRGIAGYFAIPIYSGDQFSIPLIDWVQNRPKYRYAMWHEPVLYNRCANAAIMNTVWGLAGRTFRDFFAENAFAGLAELAANAGADSFPSVNGQRVEYQI